MKKKILGNKYARAALVLGASIASFIVIAEPSFGKRR